MLPLGLDMGNVKELGTPQWEMQWRDKFGATSQSRVYVLKSDVLKWGGGGVYDSNGHTLRAPALHGRDIGICI